MRLSQEKIAAFQQKILDRYRDNKRELPRRDSDDPYKVFVSEVMLQQTQVERVIPKFLQFIDELPTFSYLAAVDQRTLLRLWSGLGFNSRAVRLKKSAQLIVDEYDSELPDDRETLQELPGIGPYTSASLLAFAFNTPAPVVDTNIRRVLIYELDLDDDLGKADLERVALAVTPAGRANDRNNALMDYGSQVATAQKTGIEPTSKQSTFAGSVRQARGRIVKYLVDHGTVDKEELAVAVDHDKFSQALAALREEGLVTISGEHVAVS